MFLSPHLLFSVKSKERCVANMQMLMAVPQRFCAAVFPINCEEPLHQMSATTLDQELLFTGSLRQPLIAKSLSAHAPTLNLKHATMLSEEWRRTLFALQFVPEVQELHISEVRLDLNLPPVTATAHYSCFIHPGLCRIRKRPRSQRVASMVRIALVRIQHEFFPSICIVSHEESTAHARRYVGTGTNTYHAVAKRCTGDQQLGTVTKFR